jgi:hypothetical protein
MPFSYYQIEYSNNLGDFQSPRKAILLPLCGLLLEKPSREQGISLENHLYDSGDTRQNPRQDGAGSGLEARIMRLLGVVHVDRILLCHVLSS